MSKKQLTLKQRTVRKHTKVDRDEQLDVLWHSYYLREANLKKDKEELVKLTSKAIADGKTLYNVTWVSPSFVADNEKKIAYYKSQKWTVPHLTVVDQKSMTQYLTDEEVPAEEWKILRKGFPKNPAKKQKPKVKDCENCGATNTKTDCEGCKEFSKWFPIPKERKK